MKPAYVKIHRSCDEGIDNWIHIIDPVTKKIVGEGKTIMDAYDGIESRGYQIMCYERAMREVECHE